VTRSKMRRARTLLQTEPGCHYCGDQATSRDHIIPQSVGGKSVWWNLVSACEPCNRAKADAWPTHDCERCHEAERLFLLSQTERVDERQLKTYGSRTYWRSIARGLQPFTKP
jgi:hypothetical protein